MTVWYHLSTIFYGRRSIQLLGLGLLCVVLTTILFFVAPASAAPSQDTVNFSARLKNKTGGVVPDGQYNIQFKFYSVAENGTEIWTETYHDSNGTAPGQDNRVQVKNGYFNVKLGSLASFAGVNWDGDIWMTMNIGGRSQTATIGEIDWDGEMEPRIQLSAVPYAMNSKTVGGKSANELVQLGQGMQTYTGSNPGIAFNKVGSGDLLQVQSSGVNAFTLHSSGSITLGATSNQSITVGAAPSGAGRNLTVAAGAGSDGGTLLLQGGSATGVDGNGGDVAIDAGAGNGEGVGGSISIGTVNASNITIGNAGSVTTVAGELSTDTIDAANAGPLTIGGDNTTAIDLGKDTTIHGSVTARDDVNSDAALQIQNAEGVEVFTVNTEDNHIQIGKSDEAATLLVLDTKTTAGDPSGVDGAMYYNSSLGKFRCYEGGEWKDCITPLPVSKVANTNTVIDEDIATDVTDLSFELAANTKYYYKFIILHEATEDTTGIGFGVTTPTSPTMSNWCVNTSATLLSASTGHWGSYCGIGDADATTAGDDNPGDIFTSTMEGYIETDQHGGLLRLRAKSEKDTKEVTIKSGSFGILQIVQ